MSALTCDVAVIGGGPAGAATALALLDAGHSVALIERSGYDQRRIGEHLTTDAYEHLDRLGVLEKVRSGPHLQPPVFRSVWGDEELVSYDYIFNAYGGGITLARPAFDLSLVEEVGSRGGKLFCRAKVENVERNGGGWRLALNAPDGGQIMDAAFLVDATGRAAWLSRKMGKRPTPYDRLVALAALLPPGNDGGGAMLESMHDGWWYTSLLPEGELAAIFLTDSDLMGEQAEGPRDYWLRMLAQSTVSRERIGAVKTLETFQSLPAMSHRLAQPVGDGWLAVGDAAMAADPLSSGGIAKGLKGGLQAAAAVSGLLKGDGVAACDYAAELEQGFDDYLDNRCKYYRMEGRWPEAPFWVRRRRPGISSFPIWLDPEAVLETRDDGDHGSINKILNGVTPDLDGKRLLKLISTSLPAHTLIENLRRPEDDGYSDQDLIVALQVLVSEGCLAVKT